MAPTANTSRAALQDLAQLLDAATAGMGGNDFALTIAVQVGAAVEGGATSYLPNSIQRITMTPAGALRVQPEPAEPAWQLEQGWDANPWAGSAWEDACRCS